MTIQGTMANDEIAYREEVQNTPAGARTHLSLQSVNPQRRWWTTETPPPPNGGSRGEG